MNDDKTKLIDNRKTTLIDKQKTKLIDKDKTVLLDVKENKENSIIEDAFINLSLHDYVIKRMISDKGGEAYIFLATKDNIEYAVKIYKKDRNTSINKIKEISSEYVMKIIDSGKFRGQYFEIMPYYSEGTLEDNIEKLDLNFIKNIVVKELNEGLKAIHDVGLVHNDIKPHNIFLSNDRKHVIIGDFGVINDLNGRDYATKYVGGFSEVFSAPEAYRYSSSKVDYFSLGMTLYHLAYKGDPFKDMSNDRVRGMIANDNVEIDSSIDSELADLIYMLIKNSPKERIGYDEVNEWLNNKSIFHLQRIKELKIKEDDFRISHDFDNKLYTSMIELTQAMNDNYELGYKHFINDFIQDDVRNASGKQELAIELKDIRKKYNDNLKLAYFITLHKLNKNLEFVYEGINYHSFNEYLENAFKEYSKYREKAIDFRIFKYLVINSDEKIKDVIDKIEKMNISDSFKFDMLLNYYTSEEKIYYNGKIYESLKDFSSILFNENLEANELEISDNILMDLLEYKYGFNGFDKSDNMFERHASISKLINGYVKLKYKNLEFKNTKDILNYIAETIEKNKSVVCDYDVLKFIKEYLVIYYKFEETKDDNFIDFLNHKDSEMLYELYLYTSENKKYYINKQMIDSVSSLVKYLEETSNLKEVSSKILNDKNFYLWLNAMGYKVKEVF